MFHQMGFDATNVQMVRCLIGQIWIVMEKNVKYVQAVKSLQMMVMIAKNAQKDILPQ